MEEHPVAFATIILSPNNWVTILRYGVSPQPEQAPENSKSGRITCCWRNVVSLTLRRSSSGNRRKKSQLSRSCWRKGACGRRLIALRRVSVFLRAGQTSTHNAHPVQSLAATFRLHFFPFHSGARASGDLKFSFAPTR